MTVQLRKGRPGEVDVVVRGMEVSGAILVVIASRGDRRSPPCRCAPYAPNVLRHLWLPTVPLVLQAGLRRARVAWS